MVGPHRYSIPKQANIFAKMSSPNEMCIIKPIFETSITASDKEAHVCCSVIGLSSNASIIMSLKIAQQGLSWPPSIDFRFAITFA